MTSEHFSFELIRREFISSNDRLHYKTHGARVAKLVAMGKAASEERGVRFDRAHLSVTVDWPDRRDRDTPNIWPTVKALEDGLVKGGLLPDDNDRFILSTLFVPSTERCTKKRAMRRGKPLALTRVNLTFRGA